jgi:hypothetical protein
VGGKGGGGSGGEMTQALYAHMNKKKKRRSETLKLIQEKIGITMNHIGIGNNFMNGTLVAQQLRENIDK